MIRMSPGFLPFRLGVIELRRESRGSFICTYIRCRLAVIILQGGLE